MFELTVVGLVSVLALLVVAWQARDERRQSMEERKELLDRIMSRDFTEYQTAKADPGPAVKVVSVDELRRELEDRDEAIGMPV